MTSKGVGVGGSGLVDTSFFPFCVLILTVFILINAAGTLQFTMVSVLATHTTHTSTISQPLIKPVNMEGYLNSNNPLYNPRSFFK